MKKLIILPIVLLISGCAVLPAPQEKKRFDFIAVCFESFRQQQASGMPVSATESARTCIDKSLYI